MFSLSFEEKLFPPQKKEKKSKKKRRKKDWVKEEGVLAIETHINLVDIWYV